MKTSLPVTVASVLFATSATCIAEPVTLDATPQRISMFKNGLAMVTSRADVPGPGAYLVAAPEARYGSLWLGWEPGLTLQQIVSRQIKHTEDAPAISVNDLLRANVGKSFAIQWQGADQWQDITLLSMPTEETEIDPQDPMGHLRSQIMPPQQGNLMMIETAGGVVGLPPNRVSAVRFPPGGVYRTINPKQVVETAIAFDAAQGEGEGNSMTLRYLAQGIAWSPSYVVEMIDEHSARIACKAVIVNDLMDLDGVDVELIAGYPNLQFAHAPTAMGPTPLAALLASLQQSGRQGYGVMSNAIVTQQSRGFDSSYGGGAFVANFPDLPVGEGAEDLYFYPVPDVTLAKGERGYYPLIFAEIPACHIYTWDIADYVDNNDRYQNQHEEVQQVVWHSLELTNATEQPWTTAPGMTVKDGRVLGQDTLNFTPPKGSSRLKITQAVSIDAQQSEVEVERQRDAETFRGNRYDKVTVEGTLKVTNYKNEAVTIRIGKLVSGEVDSAEGAPDVVKIASGLQRMNPRSKLTWETAVKPGKDNAVTITYRYSFFTR